MSVGADRQPSPGSPTSECSPSSSASSPPRHPRVGMEKPGWAVQQRARAASTAAQQQYVRTRHLSLTVDGGGSGGAAGDARRSAGHAVRTSDRPPLRKADSSPLPPRSSIPGGRTRSSSHDTEAELPHPIDEFPYSPAFAYAPVGKESTHFPCGSEAVMINSELAFEAFKSLDEVEIDRDSPCLPPRIPHY